MQNNSATHSDSNFANGFDNGYANPLDGLARANPEPEIAGLLRSQPEDFQVDEILGFEPSGEGEHVFLHIEKRKANTLQIRDLIASFVGLHSRDIGYSGLKDKHAVTRQWFSAYLPGRSKKDILWKNLETLATEKYGGHVSLCILNITRHNKKLRRGAHKGNRFALRVRNLTVGIASTDGANCEDQQKEALLTLHSMLEARINRICQRGVPNYFGEQRFGIHGANLRNAEKMFGSRRRISRDKRSLYLSAARSFLFNQVLSARVLEGSWLTYIDGDVIMLNGSHSHFVLHQERQQNNNGEQELADIERRLQIGDVHISGPMFGAGSLQSAFCVKAREQAVLEQFNTLADGLLASDTVNQRRAFRVIAQDIEWNTHDRELVLSFVLPRGSYATALMRELINYWDVSLAGYRG